MTCNGFSLIVGGTDPICSLDLVLVVGLGTECFRIPADTLKERPPSRDTHISMSTSQHVHASDQCMNFAGRRRIVLSAPYQRGLHGHARSHIFHIVSNVFGQTNHILQNYEACLLFFGHLSTKSKCF